VYEDPTNWDDPTDSAVAEESRLALVELLEQSPSRTLREFAAAVENGRLEVVVGWEDHDQYHTVRLMVPASSGRLVLDDEEDAELLGLIRSVVHAGDCHVESYQVKYVPDRKRWASRSPRPRPSGLVGDRYEVGHSVGRGGQAEVFRATDIFSGDEMALKILFEQKGEVAHQQFFERMRREMRVMSEIEHPNLIRLLDFGQMEDGRLWYTMPLAKGSLRSRMPDMDRDPASLLAVMEDIAAGLDCLAENGLVHRDLKPENVLLLDGRYVVADLGLVVDLSRESTILTRTGWGLGTQHYAPPEMMQAKEATPAWDVYSFGQTVLDLITGTKAEERVGSPLPTHDFTPAIRRALADDPADRFQSCADFVAECRRLHLLRADRSWESPSQRVERVAEELTGAGWDDAFDEMVEILEADPELVGSFIAQLSRLKQSVLDELRRTRPDTFRKVVDIALEELPPRYASFDALDPMGRFFAAVGWDGDEHLAPRALRWLTETGYHYNRWSVQGDARALASQLAKDHVYLLRPALDGLTEAELEIAIEDMEEIPPQARPRAQPAEQESASDEEPF
jgi:tRNA A-37 threonylcarbamoyl transferase component Bud32